MSDAAQEPISVSELTAEIKEVVEGSFSSVLVTGEITNFSRPQSGHCYLTLKDDRAQIRAVVWRAVAERIKFDLHDGLAVTCLGDVEVYAPRGSYQLVIRRIEPRGIGALELALRKLHAKLAAEGLFDPSLKRPLPLFPRRVAFVTSPTGAAIRDFLEVLRRRWRATDVLIIPARVQGDGAAAEIADGVALANRLSPPIDALVVGRGGGSLEDLWAFNEEVVVRAIRTSRVPVVSAVGHEIDITLSDLAADVRALTPSEAAERIAPAADEVARLLGQLSLRMISVVRGRAQGARSRLDQLAARRVFRRPFDLVQEPAQRLDELTSRATRALRRRCGDERSRIESLAARLESLSPLGVLSRGYSLTTLAADGRLVRDAGSLAPGDLLRTRFGGGQATSRVEAVQFATPPGA